MAELVYTYIEKMDTGIKNSEIFFSDKHKFKLKDRNLFYIEDKNRRFFGEKISNLSLIVGKNGVGKSSLLDLISFSNKNINLRRGRNSYFNIFHLRDNIFFIEGSPSLINKISNMRSNTGIFMTIGNNKFVTPDSQISIELQISLIRSSPIVDWFNRDSYRTFNSHSSPIIRNVKHVESAENVFRFIVEAKNSNVTKPKIFLKVNQKQLYSSNSPAILDELYGNDRITDIEDVLPEQLKRRLRLKVGENSISFNSRIVQNYYFRKHKIHFFIVQVLEKYLLNLIEFLEKNGEPRKRIFNIIKESNGEYFNRLREVDLFYLREDYISEQFLKDKIAFLENIVNDLRDWGERIKYFEGKSSRDTPFINRDALKILISNFKNSEEYGYFQGNAYKIEVSSSSLSNKDINFNFIELLMVEFSELFSVQFENLSDGEIVYFNTFSSIFMEIRKASKDGRDCVLVLDEPDLNLHPEWCRRFIDDCITLVNNYSDVNIQFIIATHSPYMISDVPKENVFSLEVKEKMVEIKRAEKSFAANIIDILSDTFFLDYSIGEFARKKILKRDKEAYLYIDDPVLKTLIERSVEDSD
ncbi:AAA family ATPase [Streptococcus parasanguinis]|uniref:AAA family ATPase n=1 Tax=Streptococcus parasanguinis TaxID=1318 RepID=UPI0039C14EF5